MLRFQPARRHAHVLRYGQDPELLVRLRLAHTLWLLGDPEGADRQRDLALAVAEKSTHPYSRATTRVWAAIVAIDRRGSRSSAATYRCWRDTRSTIPPPRCGQKALDSAV